MIDVQTPREEIAERTAEAAGLQVARGAATLRDHIQTLADHQERIRDGYRYMAESSGHKPNPAFAGAAEPMGDIFVTGDINADSGEQAAEMIAALRGRETSVERSYDQAQPSEPSIAKESRWKKAALYAALVAAGAGGGAAIPLMFGGSEPAPLSIETSADDYLGDFEIEKGSLWQPDK